MAKKRNDEPGMTVARGLATLALGKRFSLAEGADVQHTFAALVRAVTLVHELAKRVEALEREKAARPRLKVA